VESVRRKPDSINNFQTIPELLEQAGFRIRGRRADCIHCEGHSRLTISFNNEVAYCHRCQWTGNIKTLSRELGISLAPETLEQSRRRTHQAEFREWSNICYTILVRRLRYLTERAEIGKEILEEHPDCDDAWSLLAELYHDEADLFCAFDLLAGEKLSLWLEVPVAKQKLFAAFVEASNRTGVADAA
jgi:hypothetical protein